MSSCPFSERASMPEEAGKHLCSGPGHGIDEMRINRHPKTHICRRNLHALQTHLLLLSQTTLCCCTSFSRKCGSFLPPPGSHLHVFGAHSQGHLFPISIHLFHLYSSGGTGAPHHFSARGFGRRRFSSPWHITSASYSAHLQQWN